MENTIKQLWDQILQRLIVKYDITEAAVTTWIRPWKIHKATDSTITFVLDPKFDARALAFIEKRFYDYYVSLAIQDLTSKNLNVQVCLAEDVAEEQAKPVPEVDADRAAALASLNTRYTFDTFVVGKNNEIAQAASIAVAENPGATYNPLFLYGGAGLGKTHLMHSIAHHIINTRPDLKVLYVNSERFTNELIDDLRERRTDNFRQKYRNIDVFLIDDIQFIIGKDRTQEEFFHTFNSLYEDNKQIIISSDKPPRDMKILDERFRSRFEWGLTADIQPPDYETRMAILNKRAELENMQIDISIMEYVASNISSNIRELEGALNKICVFARLRNMPITLELAEEALKDLINPMGEREITPELIVDIVCEHFNISKGDITSKKKSHEIAHPRQIAMYLSKELTDKSLKSIASSLGKRDHTTVIHGYNKIKSDLTTDPVLQNTINVLKKKINPS